MVLALALDFCGCKRGMDEDIREEVKSKLSVVTGYAEDDDRLVPICGRIKHPASRINLPGDGECIPVDGPFRNHSGSQ